MRQRTVSGLAVSGIVLIVVAFVIRGFSRFVVGPETALLVAGPVAVLAAVLVLAVVVIWVLEWVGVITIENDSAD